MELDWWPETVYAVLAYIVSGVLGWIVRGLRVKPEMRSLRQEIEKLKEQKAVSEAHDRLTDAQAEKTYEEAAELRRKRLRETGYGPGPYDGR